MTSRTKDLTDFVTIKTPEELRIESAIPTVSLAHDPGWEKAGAAGTV